GRVDRDAAEPPQERRRLGVVLALDGVVDEALERLAVVAVLEHLQPLLARLFLVADLLREERGRLPPQRDALEAVAEPIAAPREEVDELSPLVVAREVIDEAVRIVVRGRIEVARLFESLYGGGLVAGAHQELGGAREVRCLRLRVAGQR